MSVEPIYFYRIRDRHTGRYFDGSGNPLSTIGRLYDKRAPAQAIITGYYNFWKHKLKLKELTETTKQLYCKADFEIVKFELVEVKE